VSNIVVVVVVVVSGGLERKIDTSGTVLGAVATGSSAGVVVRSTPSNAVANMSMMLISFMAVSGQ
jgi:hypothetical protein